MTQLFWIGCIKLLLSCQWVSSGYVNTIHNLICTSATVVLMNNIVASIPSCVEVIVILDKRDRVVFVRVCHHVWCVSVCVSVGVCLRLCVDYGRECVWMWFSLCFSNVLSIQLL